MRYQLPLCAVLLALDLAAAGPASAAKKVDLDYHVTLLPQSDQAEVRLTLEQGSVVRSLGTRAISLTSAPTASGRLRRVNRPRRCAVSGSPLLARRR